MQRFHGKTVIVTGGGGGIGGATCRRFAEPKAPKVAVFDRTSKPPQAVANGHHRRGGRPLAFACDITDRASVDAAVADRKRARPHRRAGQQRRLGHVQALHQDRPRRVGQADRHQPDRRAAHAPRRAAGHGRARAGRIVNMASDAARVGSSGEAVYAACKGGLVAFSKTLAREHARHGITVNVVCPGPTDTALFADYKEGAGNPEKLMEAFRRADSAGPHRPAGRPAGRHPVLRQRRRGLHHRPGAQRLRRPDDERLSPPTLVTCRCPPRGPSTLPLLQPLIGNTMNFEDILYEVRNGVAWITINRPTR
jgi:2-hydroxycyclohexanecarboxyl-CoA dehydrogenase